MSDRQEFACGGSGKLTPAAKAELADFSAHLANHRRTNTTDPTCRFCIATIAAKDLDEELRARSGEGT